MTTSDRRNLHTNMASPSPFRSKNKLSQKASKSMQVTGIPPTEPGRQGNPRHLCHNKKNKRKKEKKITKKFCIYTVARFLLKKDKQQLVPGQQGRSQRKANNKSRLKAHFENRKDPKEPQNMQPQQTSSKATPPHTILCVCVYAGCGVWEKGVCVVCVHEINARSAHN